MAISKQNVRVAMALVSISIFISACGSESVELAGSWAVQQVGEDEYEYELVILSHINDELTGYIKVDDDQLKLKEGRYGDGELKYTVVLDDRKEMESTFALQSDGSFEGVSIITRKDNGRVLEEIQTRVSRVDSK